MGWHSLQSLRTTFGDSRYLERRRQRQTYCSKESPRTRQHFKSWKVGSFKLSRGRSRGLPSAYPSLGKTGGQEYTAERCPQTLLARNISLCLQFVPSRLNQADAPSRVLSDKDCMLAPEPWKELENLFGPHTFDLMAFDSNAQIGCSSSPLPHFTPFPTPDSRGVNVFAQDEASQEDTCFSAIHLGPLLRFLDKALFSFTIVVPKLSPRPYWWPLIQARASHFVVLGHKADHDILLFPSPHHVFSTRPLPWDLYAFRNTNSLPSVLSLDSAT